MLIQITRNMTVLSFTESVLAVNYRAIYRAPYCIVILIPFKPFLSYINDHVKFVVEKGKMKLSVLTVTQALGFIYIS